MSIRPREYLIVKQRDMNGFPKETVHIIGVEDDAGSDARFATAVYEANVRLGQIYPFADFSISQAVTVNGQQGIEIETYKASKILAGEQLGS